MNIDLKILNKYRTVRFITESIEKEYKIDTIINPVKDDSYLYDLCKYILKSIDSKTPSRVNSDYLYRIYDDEKIHICIYEDRTYNIHLEKINIVIYKNT
jgi:hypothetical protein